MEWFELPDNWEVAGYDDSSGNWQDVENGDPDPSQYDLEMADQVVLSYRDDNDEVHYWTVHGGFDEDYPIEDAISDLLEMYGEG